MKTTCHMHLVARNVAPSIVLRDRYSAKLVLYLHSLKRPRDMVLN